MDIMTLAAAKSYTDKKTANGSAADLSNYYTKQEIDDKEFVTQDQLQDEGYIVDDSLTIDGAAADAKATGERLTDIEYQTVITDIAQTHSNLPEGNKTVTISGDGTWGDTVYVSSGEDLVPRKTFNRKFPYNGITIERNGYTYHLSGTATALSTICLTHESTNGMTENVRGLGGKTLKLVGFADTILGEKVRIFIEFFDESKTNLSGQIKNPLFKSSTMGVNEIVVPENTAYMTIYFTVMSGAVLDNDIQVYLNLAEKTQASTKFENIAVNDDESNYVMSFPYKSTVDVKASIGEYIKYKTANAKGDTATYLTPEAFGAVGDGYTNDTEAVNACISKAAETRQTILMAQKYLVSAPIDIKGNDFNIIINDIVYSGTDTAVKIHGQRNTVKIHSIASSGVGVKFLADGTKFSEWTLNNNLEVNSITAASHGIMFTAENAASGSYQNTVHFNYIQAGGTSCYGIAYFNSADCSSFGEDNFYGGQITNCEWACYGIRGNSKFYGIQVEGNVQGGFYIVNQVRIIQPRFTESSRDGSYPFFKFVDAKLTKIDSGVNLAINEIDISENRDYYENANGTQGSAHEAMLGIIDLPLTAPRTEVGEDIAYAATLTNKAYIWGKYLIMTPFMAYRKEVTTATLDTRLIDKPKSTIEETYTGVFELSQLPTKFVVNTINTDIYLHASYCAFGFNEFEVEQLNGFTCKIYDVHENLIFDGTDKGDGLYRLNVYKDADICMNRAGAKGLLSVDFLGHYWSVTKESISATDDGQGNVTLTTGGIGI